MLKIVSYFLLSFLIFGYGNLYAQTKSKPIFTIENNFPGGNIVVDSIAGTTVYLHQNLNDVETSSWFYWYFRIKGAAGKKITFKFIHPWGEDRKYLNVIGVRGPAISLDGGNTWAWMGANVVKEASFSYYFPKNQSDVRFSFGMPYVESNFKAFLKKYQNHYNLEVNPLALTKGNREVERLNLGSIHGKAKYRIVITARHHASEMMANYALEGIIKFLLEDQQEGKWFRENVEALIIPFVDKDGVEKGEQGKGRRGRDHNLDYAGQSIYPEIAAIRSFVPAWSKGKLVVGIDLHCPWIRGDEHEKIHQVGSSGNAMQQEQRKFGLLLEKQTVNAQLNYNVTDDLMFGTLWNTLKSNDSAGRFKDWIAEIPSVKLRTTIELPYANASGKAVTQESARNFGKDMAIAIIQYLKAIDHVDK